MSTRKLATLIALTTMAATGGYVFVYLARWEWNRALVSAAIFLAAEVGLVALVLGTRLNRIEQALAAPADLTVAEVRVRRHLREAGRPDDTPSFAWLHDGTRTGVFVPVLMGAGVVLSAVAWVVERIARATVNPAAERALARRLGSLELPAHGLLGTTAPDPVALLRGPVAGGRS